MKKSALDDLIGQIAKLPGLGPRSARRIVLHMLQKKDDVMPSLAALLLNCAEEIIECVNCHNLDTEKTCGICANDSRDNSILCIVESVGDLWALERNRAFRGLYHVLGGCLDIVKGVTPDKLKIESLMQRLDAATVQEVIIALPSTLEGQTTAFYICDLLKEKGIKISRLAHGIPIGADLDYMDEGTIAHAINTRQSFH